MQKLKFKNIDEFEKKIKYGDLIILKENNGTIIEKLILMNSNLNKRYFNSSISVFILFHFHYENMVFGYLNISNYDIKERLEIWRE